jgi:hypothetical protein
LLLCRANESICFLICHAVSKVINRWPYWLEFMAA